MPQRFGEPPIGHGSTPAHTEPNADHGRENLHEQFERVLKGRFDIVRPDVFMSDLPGIDRIVISKVENPDGKVPVLTITPMYTTAEGKRHTLDSFQITESGKLVGKFGPRMQGVTKEQIFDDVLRIFDASGLGTYPTYNVDIEILPDTIDTQPGVEPFKGVEHAHDPRREQFLRSQQGALFMFRCAGQHGFGGMYVYVFDRFLYVDSELTENAAFFFDQREPIQRDPAMPSPNDPKAFTAWVQQQPWFSPLLMQRKDAWKSGTGIRKFHSGEWEQRIQSEIDKRR